MKPPIVQPVVEQKEQPVVTQQVIDPLVQAFKSSNVNYQPAHWVITPKEDDIIHARNNITTLEFEGTRKDFSEMLRTL